MLTITRARKYLVSFFDMYDKFVTSGYDVSAFKMKPDEHVLFVSSHKAPYNKHIPARVTVERSGVGSWPLNPPSLTWRDIDINLLPEYAAMSSDNKECAAVNETRPGWLSFVPSPSANQVGYADICVNGRICGELFQLYHLGYAGENGCPEGSREVDEDECQDAGAKVLPKGKSMGREFVAGWWGHVPPGCSLQSYGDWAPHFNRNPEGKNDDFSIV